MQRWGVSATGSAVAAGGLALLFERLCQAARARVSECAVPYPQSKSS